MILASCPHGCTFEVAVLTEADRDRVEAAHNRRHHGETVAPLPVAQLDHVSWQQAFLTAVAALPIGTELTTADLHALVPPPAHHNSWGSATAAAKHLGLIRSIDTQQSDLATTRGSLVHRWVRVATKVRTA